MSGFIHNLRASLPYLEEFHQQTFVVQLSGDLLNGHNFRVIEDLALLQKVGIRIVLIHGAETQIRKFLTDVGLVCQTEDGILVAKETHLPLIEQAISSANWQLLTRFRSCSRQLQTLTGHFMFAEKKSNFEKNSIKKVITERRKLLPLEKIASKISWRDKKLFKLLQII